MHKEYFVTIGIETHVQLKTRSKLFSGAGNDAREAPPNSLISHIDMGLPGALPVLNQAAVKLAAKAAFALNTTPQPYSKFDRKHYFYPDLPNGYQITQFYDPIIKNGSVEFLVNGEKKTVGIYEAHLEADAGKSVHPAGKDYSLIDLNRVGTPLLEIVSSPEMHSPAEAKAYARELYLLMRYAEVSDASLYWGNMRFDVNVSVSKDRNSLGTRTETKNLNSFRSVEKAAEYEIKRQVELLEKGQSVVQETRGWDDAKQRTFSQRGKEQAHDYRYMPDPDLPPIVLNENFIEDIRRSMPDLPNDFRKELNKLDIDQSAVEKLIDDRTHANFIKQVLSDHGGDHARRIANWFVNVVNQDLQDSEERDSLAVTVESAVNLSELVDQKKLSSTAAKEIWQILYAKGGSPEEIAKEKNLLQVSDAGEIRKIVQQVLVQNEKAANDVKSGEMKAIGFLVGQVMKMSKGQANPSMAQQLIKEELGL